MRQLSAFLTLALACTSCFAADLVVSDANGTSFTLSGSDLERLPVQTVSAKDHGVEKCFTGIDLRLVLKAAGIQVEKLGGARLRTVLLVEAADGYRVAIALPELDPTLGNMKVLLAIRENNSPLDLKTGPLRLLIPADTRAARWVRQVERLTIKLID